ncbi:hypothetical protein K474DRAFT_1703969 [Panus rudis PR-1116 ss-1]|nr:hypothetical protein K474DRAFT_1703969 [Panus rudis PR-1116 ss-1]
MHAFRTYIWTQERYRYLKILCLLNLDVFLHLSDIIPLAENLQVLICSAQRWECFVRDKTLGTSCKIRTARSWSSIHPCPRFAPSCLTRLRITGDSLPISGVLSFIPATVEELHVDSVNMDFLDPDLPPFFFPNIQKLRLVFDHGSTKRSCKDIPTIFPNVRTLALTKVWESPLYGNASPFAEVSQSSVDIYDETPSWNSLEEVGGHLDVLGAFELKDGVEFLNVNFRLHNEAERQKVTSLAHAVRPRAMQFVIERPQWVKQFESFIHSGGQCLTHVKVVLDLDTPSNPDLDEWIKSVMHALSCTSLQYVEIHLLYESFDCLGLKYRQVYERYDALNCTDIATLVANTCQSPDLHHIVVRKPSRPAMIYKPILSNGDAFIVAECFDLQARYEHFRRQDEKSESLKDMQRRCTISKSDSSK